MQQAPFASNVFIIKSTRYADLNLVYRAEFLRNIVRKLREEGIKVGYHSFVALQDLYTVSVSRSERDGVSLPAGTSSGYHCSHLD